MAWTVLDVTQLRKINLFSAMSERALGEVAALSGTEEYRAGKIIFKENDPGDCFYFILNGAVRISKFIPGMGEEALAILKEGDYFGEMALLDDEPRSAAAIADCSCLLSVIRKGDFHDLLKNDHRLQEEILWNMVGTLARRLRETNAKMTFLAAAGKF